MRRWTAEEEALLKEALQQKHRSQREIARTLPLNRSVGSIRGKIRTLVTTDHSSEVAAYKERISKLEKRNKELHVTVSRLLKQQIPTVLDYTGTPIRFGVVSDTHAGSFYCDWGVLDLAYDIFAQEGITKVLHAGDLLDGYNVYRGQEFEVEVIGASAQVQQVVAKYPQRVGVTTFFITGNHDEAFFKSTGTDIGEMVHDKREDMQFLGRRAGVITMRNDDYSLRVEVVHPGKGTAYALSYHPQKFVEALPGGTKPAMWICGHYHKAEFIPAYRNVMALQAGCIQRQTPFMRSRGIAAMVGFWVVELVPDKKGAVRCKVEFFPIYERTT